MTDSDLLSIFWVEVSEYLEQLNAGLLKIEMIAPDDPEYPAQLREMNRVAHSMKGAARAVGIGLIETVSHYMEEVLEAAMRGDTSLTPAVADSMYDGLDLIQNLSDGVETDADALANVLANLESLLGDSATDAPSGSKVFPAVAVNNDETTDNAPTPDSSPSTEVTPPPSISNGHVDASQPSATSKHSPQPEVNTLVMRPAEETVRVTVGKLDKLMAEATELLVARMNAEEEQSAVYSLRRMYNNWQREWRGVRAAYIRMVRRMQDEGDKFGAELPQLIKFLENNQRYLTDMNRQLSAISASMVQSTMHLSTLADQLQDDISSMRMMPFEAIVGVFQRMVRDIARDMGKQIHLDIEGGAVEIDKTVLDMLKDPLIHLLRNAIDHGIETPDERVAKDKSPTGFIRVSVEQRGSEIIIRVKDDGKGINADDVRDSIVERGIMTDAEAQSLSDDEARVYVFHSGLSTSAQVTALSGRGLGMDIVRDRVEGLRGRVSVQSVVGEGTTVTMNVPVSLTRIRCILLRIGDEQFAVPSAIVARMGDIDRDEVFTAEGHDMLIVNERPVPLVSMGAVLDVPSSGEDEVLSFVALQATDRLIAFEVDHLISEQELVLKPLGPELARAPFVAGASLLGTGEVIILLDANDIVRRATGATLMRRKMLPTAHDPVSRRVRVLVVDDSITTRTLEKNILETAGFDVHVAMDGVEAWRMLAEVDFDLVISDVEMPNMNGLQLTERIKTSGQYHHIPVILLTSLAKPEQREAGLRAGADAYLVKSRFDQGELLLTIQSVVG